MDILPITRLYRIFKQKEWIAKDNDETIFNNFGNLLDNLTEQQRELILELVERYTWITFSEYQSKLISVFDKVEAAKIQSLKTIILFPVMKPEDEGITKSGHQVLYMVRALKPYLLKYKHIVFKEIETFGEIINDSFEIKKNEAIFLLDDYLGSSETIQATVHEILKNRKIQPDHLNIISIAAQKESLNFIDSVGISSYTDFISLKGISDYYVSPTLEMKTKLMQEIEKMMSVHLFNFGYNTSEALITLMRTPDNTFPVFWKSYKKNGILFDAPFSRY